MPTALDLNFDWGGMKHTATASKSFVRLVSMVLALRLTTIYHEIFGLALIVNIWTWLRRCERDQIVRINNLESSRNHYSLVHEADNWLVDGRSVACF